MKQELSATVVWIIVGAAVVVVALVIYFGAIRPGTGPGPVVKTKPWSPAGYGRSAPGGGRTAGQPSGSGGAPAGSAATGKGN